MRLAADAHFDVWITPDKNIGFQQNLTRLPIAVIVLRARTNRIEELAPLLPELHELLQTIEPRSFHRVGE